MEVKPGYRQTEVGVIPAEWSVKPFSEIGKLTKGKGLLKEDIKRSGSTPAIPYTALYTDFSELVDYSLIKWFIDDETQTVIVREPCLLLASSSNMEANTGKASALIGTTPVAIGREVIVFKTSSDCAFISYLLSTPIYRRRTLTLARGTTIKHVYPATFQDYQVAHPPLPEQRAIATALSDVDRLLGGLDRLIAKKRDLKQAAMQQLLTGQTRLPGFHGKWEVKTIDQVGFVMSGKRLPLGCALVEQPTPHPYVRVADMRPGTVDLSEIKYVPENVFPAISRYRIFCDDVFISVAGSLGIVGKVPKELDGANLTENADRITNITCSQDFLLHVLMSPLIQKTIDSIQTVGAQPKLALTRIRKFVIPYPPIPEQTAIAEVLSDMVAELAALEQRREKTRSLKQAMMQELLTGRIRLVESVKLKVVSENSVKT
jgi:type I restriction enzyme S subunit